VQQQVERLSLKTHAVNDHFAVMNQDLRLTASKTSGMASKN